MRPLLQRYLTRLSRDLYKPFRYILTRFSYVQQPPYSSFSQDNIMFRTLREDLLWKTFLTWGLEPLQGWLLALIFRRSEMDLWRLHFSFLLSPRLWPITTSPKQTLVTLPRRSLINGCWEHCAWRLWQQRFTEL